MLISLYSKAKRRNKDKLAVALMRELNKAIKPATTGLLAEDAFDIHYAEKVFKRENGRMLTLSHQVARDYARRIHEAWGGWWVGGDDETKVYGVFRELRDKVQVSQVAKAYQELYRENLIDKLHDKLEKKEVKKVLDIVGPLAEYRIKGEN